MKKVVIAEKRHSRMNPSDGFYDCVLECGHTRSVDGMTGFRSTRRFKEPPKRLKCNHCEPSTGATP